MEKGTVSPDNAKDFADGAFAFGGNVVLVQGKKAQVYKRPEFPRLTKPKKRGIIKTFSPGARRRLLDWIAIIDWDALPRGMFITLTYPDEVANRTYHETTDQRNHLILKMERYLKEKLLLIWRKELAVRKSGRYRKFLVQHFHLCVFTEKRPEVSRIKQWWKECIGWAGNVQVHRKLMPGQHAAFYMAKYLTKPDEEESILEDVTYVNKPGKAWDWRRKELLPLKPLDYWIGLSNEEYDRVLEQALCLCPKAIEHELESFTVRGVPSDEVRRIVREVLS